MCFSEKRGPRGRTGELGDPAKALDLGPEREKKRTLPSLAPHRESILVKRTYEPRPGVSTRAMRLGSAAGAPRPKVTQEAAGWRLHVQVDPSGRGPRQEGGLESLTGAFGVLSKGPKQEGHYSEPGGQGGVTACDSR